MRRTERFLPRANRRPSLIIIEALESREMLSHTAFEVPRFLVKHADFSITPTTAGETHGHFAPASLVVKPLHWSHHSRHKFEPNGSGRSSTGTVSAPYTPSQIRQAYGISQLSQTGAGQTIAIIDAYDDPTIASDLHKFDQTFGLTDPTFTKVVPSSGTPAYNSGWAMEIALDVEWAHAIAPGAKIMLVEAASSSERALLSAVDYATSHGANQVSMSWGGGEFMGETYLDSHFKVSGVSFTASSGDSGAGASYPAASPYVTTVGGTSLTITTAGARASETAWSGSGGGNSSYESKPTYQTGFSTSMKRAAPDVSYDADPNTGLYVYNSSSGGGGWYQVGGTSAGAPQWAGLFALANQGRASLGKTPLGTGQTFGTNTALYTLAGGTSYSLTQGNYFDVIAGSNGGSTAGKGYDVVTGLGSPVANKLIPALINS